jgi:Transposase IS66 family
MNRAQVTEIINEISPAIDAITDDNIKSIFKVLLNVIEDIVSENDTLREENQKLRDENNRLKGEQGKPNIRKQKQGSQNFSSEKERNRKKKKNKKRNRENKINKINIDRVEIRQIDKATLPEDAIFKGYQEVVVQDLVIRTDNIKFKKAMYYSPSLKKTFIAELPDGYDGEFGPGIKTLSISLYNKSKMTQSAIVEFLRDHGTFIGNATVSGFLTRDLDVFHQEKQDIVRKGLLSTLYQQMDDTSARVNGKNYYVHILCNEFYTAYFTRPNKDRMTILAILFQGEMQFIFNDTAFTLMKSMKLPEKIIQYIQRNPVIEKMNRNEIDRFLNILFPDPNRHHTNRRIILESSAIAAYRNLPTAIPILLTDDAAQYDQIAPLHPLCWIHDGRHYKKLNPVIPEHIQIADQFRENYWDFYDNLLAYKLSPTESSANSLRCKFDKLFQVKTGYDKLDERIEKTRQKKDQLLLVLEYPAIPLHNNNAELGARDQARRRDINLHTVSKAGTESKDTFMTLAQTAKKLAVNFYHYIRDRLEKKNSIPPLASMIAERNIKLVFNSSL